MRYGEDAGHGVDCADAGMLGRPVSGTTCSSASLDMLTLGWLPPMTKAFRAVWVRS